MTRKPDDPAALPTIDLAQLDTVTGGKAGNGYQYSFGQQQQQKHHKHKKHKKHKHNDQGSGINWGWSDPGSDPSGGGWDGGW